MTRYTIVNGPSKWDLMLAFFDKLGNRRRSVIFTMKEGGPADSWTGEVVVNNLEWEDGSSESWNFKGYATFLGVKNGVRGYFGTMSRKGWIEFEEELNEADIANLLES